MLCHPAFFFSIKSKKENVTERLREGALEEEVELGREGPQSQGRRHVV